MAEILRYVVVDDSGVEGDWEYDKHDEAVSAAGSESAVIQRTYIYDDSELVWTPDGSQTWPPQEIARRHA